MSAPPSLNPTDAVTAKRPTKHRQWRFTEEQVVDWVDAWFRRHRRWPAINDGVIPFSGEADWALLDRALRHGRYGLAPHSGGLPMFLHAHRGAPLRARSRGPLALAQVLDWAQRHQQRTGLWPVKGSGRIPEAPGENWAAIDAALREGLRGLSGGQSLSLVLEAHFGIEKREDRHVRFKVDEVTIIQWAREHVAETGKWPSQRGGTIRSKAAGGRNWNVVDQALRLGLYGLPGGSSLGQLLAKHRSIAPKGQRPPLAEAQIARWAQTYQQAHGKLPTGASGMVLDERGLPTGNTWRAIDSALREGIRGLPGGDTLIRLLARTLGRPVKRVAPPLDVQQVVAWERSWKARTGKWPGPMSGPIPEAPGETWAAVIMALVRGARGLPKEKSLAQLRRRHEGQ